MRDTTTPPELRSLAKLLKRRKISEIEFNAALVYFRMNNDMRRAVENLMRDAPRDMVRSIVASGVNVMEAMARLAPAHSTAATYRLRAALAELSEAIEMAERQSARRLASS